MTATSGDSALPIRHASPASDGDVCEHEWTEWEDIGQGREYRHCDRMWCSGHQWRGLLGPPSFTTAVHRASVRDGMWTPWCAGTGWDAPLASDEHPEQVTCVLCKQYEEGTAKAAPADPDWCGWDDGERRCGALWHPKWVDHVWLPTFPVTVRGGVESYMSWHDKVRRS